jgi:hypothetical protein
MYLRNIEEKKPCLGYLKSWNVRPKPYPAICFLALLLVVFFEDIVDLSTCNNNKGHQRKKST